MLFGNLSQLLALQLGFAQAILPAALVGIANVDRQFNHAFLQQFLSAHPAENVRLLARRRRKLDDDTRVETLDRLLRQITVSLMAFVKNHRRLIDANQIWK